MSIPHDAPDHALPPELKAALEKAHGDVVFRLRVRLNKPIPGNPYGGFPGLDLHEHSQELKSARRALISRFNHENPDYEYVKPVQPEAPPPPTEEEVRRMRRKMAAREIDHKHNEHVDKHLAENYPEHEHDELREFVEYERQTPFNERMEAIELMKAKGLNPDDLKHRLEHHRANSIDTSDKEQTDAQS